MLLRVGLTVGRGAAVDSARTCNRGRDAGPVDCGQGADRRQRAARSDRRAATRFWQAIWYIVVADITMSADNILAIAGASKGQLLADRLRARGEHSVRGVLEQPAVELMDRFAWLVYLGAGILGKVGGEMIFSDPAIVRAWDPGEWTRRAVELAVALVLIAAGYLMSQRKRNATA